MDMVYIKGDVEISRAAFALLVEHGIRPKGSPYNGRAYLSFEVSAELAEKLYYVRGSPASCGRLDVA